MAGNMVVFWTRNVEGVEERSWHGGEVVPDESECEKWAVTKFKEMPSTTFIDDNKYAAFVADSLCAPYRVNQCKGMQC